MREMEDLSDWKISLKIADKILYVYTGLLRKVCSMLVSNISLIEV